MTERVHDVTIVGGGPAGSAAAIALAERGLDVVLLDKATFPRDKACGDGLTTLALRELERIGFDPGSIPSWTPVSTAHLHSPAGRTVSLPLRTSGADGWFAAVAPRLELDAALLSTAEDRGAQLRLGSAVTAATMARDEVVVRTDDGAEVRSRWAIGADGIWSSLRKALGLFEFRYRGESYAVRQYLHSGSEQSRELHVWFEPDLLPGYAWSFPLPDGRNNVGFGVLRDTGLTGAALARLWDDLLTRPSVRSVLGDAPTPDGQHRAWPIPARVSDTVLGAGRVLFVGDAARATDLFTGEGIGQALLTGRLAAETIMGGTDDDPTLVASTYSRTVLDHLAAGHRMAGMLSRLVRRRPTAEAAIALVDTNDWTRRNVGRWLFEDSPRGIAFMPSQWRRGVLSGPPAYATEPTARI